MKQQILQKATQLFGMYGVKSITMDDLAKELGVSKKTIYQYYQSKKELVAAFSDYVTALLDQKFLDLLQVDASPIEKHFLIKEHIREIFGFHFKVKLSYEMNKYYPEIAQNLEKKHDTSVLHFIQKNIEQGKKEGYYRASIDVEYVSKLFLIATNSVIDNVQSLEYNEDLTFFEVSEKFIEIFIRGLATPKGTKEIERVLNK